MPKKNLITLFVTFMTFSRLEIISGEPSDTVTGQIHFNSVTYRFWPVKFMRQITLKTRAKKQLWVQIFRGVEGPLNLLQILSNTTYLKLISAVGAVNCRQLHPHNERTTFQNYQA